MTKTEPLSLGICLMMTPSFGKSLHFFAMSLKDYSKFVLMELSKVLLYLLNLFRLVGTKKATRLDDYARNPLNKCSVSSW